MALSIGKLLVSLQTSGVHLREAASDFIAFKTLQLGQCGTFHPERTHQIGRLHPNTDDSSFLKMPFLLHFKTKIYKKKSQNQQELKVILQQDVQSKQEKKKSNNTLKDFFFFPPVSIFEHNLDSSDITLVSVITGASW